MINQNDNMSIGGIGLAYYDPHQIGHEVVPELPRKSSDWLSAFFYLLPPLLLVIRITIFIRRREGTEFAEVDFHAGIEAALVMITCAILAVSRRTRLVLGRISHTFIGMLLVFYGFAGLSAGWSAMPAYTAFRALEFISQLIAIIVGVSCFEDFFKAEKAVLILGLLVALLGLAGTAKLWNFTTLKTNQYAASASMVLCYCFAEMPQAVGRRRRTLIVFGLISFPIIAVGLCATTNVATFVGLLSGAALTRSRTALIFAVVLLAVVLILVPGLTANFLEMTKDILFPGKTDAQIRGLHGRVSMWESQLALGKTSPYIGHGFAVQSRLQGTISSHNAFVQVFLDTGIIGILVFSISLLMLVGGVVKRWKTVSIGLPGCAAVFICVFVHLLSLVLIGAQWLAPSFTFAAFAGLYVNHIHGVTNYRLPHSELEYERCLGYKIVS